jgi:hypothetical protein
MTKYVRQLLGLAFVPGRALAAAVLGVWCLAMLLPAPCCAQGFMADISPQEFTAAPGEVITGELRVSSTSDKPVDLRVYLADSVRGPEILENYTYSDELGREPRSLAAWTKFTPEQLTLLPGASQLVTFEIQVPTDAALNGSYWSTLFVSNATTADKVLAKPPSGGVGMGINMMFRFATFLSVTIKGTEQKAMRFTKIDVQQDGSWFDVIAVLQNTGNTVSRPSSRLELRDQSGQAIYTSAPSPRYVLPDSSRLIRFEVRTPIPAGEYLLMAIADYGAPKLIGAQGRMSIDEASAKAMQQADAESQAAKAADQAEPDNAGDAPPAHMPSGDTGAPPAEKPSSGG